MKTRSIAILVLIGFVITGMSIMPNSVQGVTCPPYIRVGLTTTETVCDFKVVTGGYQITGGTQSLPLAVYGGSSLWRAAFVPDQKSIQVFSMNNDGSWADLGSYPQVDFTPQGDLVSSIFSYNNKPFRGALTVTVNRAGTGMNVINRLPLEQYLYGVVPREMSNQWPAEALKAQAVAARTYTVKNLGKHNIDGFDVCDETNCQVYGGYAVEGDNSRQAVDGTAGQVLIDKDGKLIYALYSSNSGGYTEDNQNVNGYYYSYLISKPDPYSMGLGLSDWGCQVPIAADGSGRSLSEKLRNKYPDIGPIAGITLSKYVSGRVYQVTISDENGRQFQLSGRELGNMFNPGFYTYVNNQNFMSSMFDTVSDAKVSILNGGGSTITVDGGLKNMYVANSASIMSFRTGGDTYQVVSATASKIYPKSPQNITFVGHGWGHGVGMSQWGAYGMAGQNKTYQEILQFYYDGAILTTLQ
ncbi:MAG: SpoIID/LytB domain-containing protein [Deltaproteobacteria bacterium]